MKQIKLVAIVGMLILSTVMVVSATADNFTPINSPAEYNGDRLTPIPQGTDGRTTPFSTNIATDVPFTSTPYSRNTPTATDTTPEGVELVQNGGFELKDGSDKAELTPWTLQNTGSDKVKCDQPEKPVAYSGSCGFVFNGQIGENSELAQVIDLDDVTLAAGDTVTLSAFIKAPDATTEGKIKLRVSYTDSTEKGKLNLNLAPARAYTKIEDTLLLTGEVAKIKLQIKHNSAAGKVYIDDASLIWLTAEAGQLISLP